MTNKQMQHLDRKFMKLLKREIQQNRKLREKGLILSLNPERLPK